MIKESQEPWTVYTALNGAEFPEHAAEKVLPVTNASLMLRAESQGSIRRDWNCQSEAFYNLNLKVYSPEFQLILQLLIPAGLKVLSPDARPPDRACHSSPNSQRTHHSTATARSKPPREPAQMANNLFLSLLLIL